MIIDVLNADGWGGLYLVIFVLFAWGFIANFPVTLSAILLYAQLHLPSPI